MQPQFAPLSGTSGTVRRNQTKNPAESQTLRGFLFVLRELFAYFPALMAAWAAATRAIGTRKGEQET